MSDTSIMTSDQKVASLVNPEFTGNDNIGGSLFPPVINILQSDKQYEAFGEEGDSITKSMYGKLFIRRREGNSLADLKDEISGTVLSIQKGHEVYEEFDGVRKIVGSDRSWINAKDRDLWLSRNPGKEYKNMIKIVLSPKSDIQEIVEDVESGLNPFCLLVIKGASFGSWFEADKQMNALSMASKVYSHKKANELAVSVFKLSITSKEEYNEKIKNSYYVPSIKVTLNEPDVAYEFQQFSFKFKELDLFYRVAEVVNEEQSAVDKKTLFKDTDNTSIVESSLLD